MDRRGLSYREKRETLMASGSAVNILFQEPDSTSMHTEEGEGEGPKSKSSSFSISAILSEEIGRKRPSASSPPSQTDREERRFWTESIGGSPPAPSTISLMQAGSIVMSPVTTAMYRSPMATSFQGSLPQPVLPYHGTPSHFTPGTITQPSFNGSFCISPFNSSLLSVLGNQSSPSQEDVFSDSLGMLSTVALYHSELSSLNSSSGSGSTPVQHRLAAMRLASGSETSLGSQEGQNSREIAESTAAAASRKSATPYILKRDRRRRRKRTSSGGGSYPDGRHSSGVLNTGFLSPLASEKVPSALSTFSPSIFLRRPERSDWSSESSSVPVSVLAPLGSPVSEPEYSHPPSEVGGGEAFVTSTPIKSDKENVQLMSPSPGMHIEHRGGRRLFLNDNSEVSSSGSDSDVPAKRPRLAPRKSRARTKLSPLLENACSPIAKTDLPQPSPLAAARLAPQSIFSHQPRPMAAVPNFVPEITVHDVDHRTTSTVNEMTSHASNISSESLHAYRTYLSSSASSSSLQNLQISQAHSYPYFPPPDTHQFQFFSPHYYTHLPQKWGSSPVTSQWNRSGQIQSVPPWFIFANNRLEGKRLRLSEAINRSLSETPAQNPKLPPEWTKYACGQTDDQKVLTEKARVFLQCRPRQLTFDDSEDD